MKCLRTHDVCAVSPKGGKDAAIKGKQGISVRLWLTSCESDNYIIMLRIMI